MNLRAFLCLVIVALLTIQPSLPTIGEAGKAMDCCAMSKCHQKEGAGERAPAGKPARPKACDSWTCNPLMGCPYCSYIVVERAHLPSPVYFAVTIQLSAMDDNRIVDQSADCWHPPNSAQV